MSKSGGVFQIDDVTRTMSKGGGAPGVPPIQVQTPPPTWLAGYGPAWGIGLYRGRHPKEGTVQNSHYHERTKSIGGGYRPILLSPTPVPPPPPSKFYNPNEN